MLKLFYRTHGQSYSHEGRPLRKKGNVSNLRKYGYHFYGYLLFHYSSSIYHRGLVGGGKENVDRMSSYPRVFLL